MSESATAAVTCPYCWSVFETTVEMAVGSQEYYEDCPVCCNPARLRVTVDATGQVASVEADRGND